MQSNRHHIKLQINLEIGHLKKLVYTQPTGCVSRSLYGKLNSPTYLGRLCLFYPSGDEDGAGVL